MKSKTSNSTGRNLIQDAIERNDEAVDELSIGNSEAAIGRFDQALQYLHEATNPQRRHHQRSQFGYKLPPLSYREIRFLEEEHFYIYNCGVTVASLPPLTDNKRTRKTDVVPCSRSDILAYSICVRFNLALAHHQRGHRTGTTSSLKRALVCYQECYAALDQLSSASNDSGSSQPGESFTMMVLAVLNNQAHIMMSLLQNHDDDEHSEKLQEVLCTSLYAVTTTDLYSCFSAFEQYQLREFLTNYMFLQQQKKGGSICAASTA